MRVLVTGGSGFIGTNLVEHFRARGDEVVNLDIVEPRNSEHAPQWHCSDLLDAPALRATLQEVSPELVFHLAARTDLWGRSILDYSANTQGVKNLIGALQTIPPPRLTVFASSMLVCRMGYRPIHETDYCPNTAYGESKVEGERLVRRLAGALPWVMVRPTSIWGPWFGPPYRNFFTAIQRGLYMHPKGYRIRRSYGFVLNAVHQLACLGERGGGPLLGRTVYLADHEPLELKQWADTIQVALGVRPIWEVPLGLLRVVSRLGDLTQRLGWNNPPLTSFRLNNLLTDMIHDTTPLRDHCGALPYSLEEAVQITCRWMDRA